MHLRDARRRKGITQAELAHQIGRTQAFIAFLESGRTRHPTYTDVVNIAAALGCDAGALTFQKRRSSKSRAVTTAGVSKGFRGA